MLIRTFEGLRGLGYDGGEQSVGAFVPRVTAHPPFSKAPVPAAFTTT